MLTAFMTMVIFAWGKTKQKHNAVNCVTFHLHSHLNLFSFYLKLDACKPKDQIPNNKSSISADYSVSLVQCEALQSLFVYYFKLLLT